MEPNKEIALASRKKVLSLVYLAGTSHIGSLFGAADIMAVLFEKIDFEKDKFIPGKSWVAALLYYHLWRKGRITQEELDSYCMPGSKWIGLVEGGHHKDIPFSVGSMGFALAAGVGYALSKKMKGEEGSVYVLETDGGMNIGINWEAIAIASQHRLDNLVLIIEDNGLCAMGKTDDILSVRNLPARLESFGWEVDEIDGHRYGDIEFALAGVSGGRPKAIIAHTIKGKGVPEWEGNNLYHYAQVKEDDFNYAMQCLK